MKKQKLQPSAIASSSIDQWQDDEGVKVPWYDSPLWGAMLVCCAIFSLFGWSAISNTVGNSNRPVFADGGAIPEPLQVEINDARNRIENGSRNDSASQHSSAANARVNDRVVERAPSIPTATTKKTPADVPALLTELSEPRVNGNRRSSNEIRKDLSKVGCDNEEIVRRLTERLQVTVDAHKFEGLVLAMDDISFVLAENPDIKERFAEAMLAAGQHLEVSQIRSMDHRVGSMILDYTQLPQSLDLLGKLASSRDNMGREVLAKLFRWNSEKAPEIAVKMVREHELHPRHLNKKDSEVVCHFLWEGKLAGKEGFSNVTVGDSEASLKGFSKAAVSAIDSDPSRMVESLVSFSWDRHRRFTRDSLPEEFVQKMDHAIAAKVEKYLSEGNSKASSLLTLAGHLGGSESVIAIAKMGTNDPSLFKRYAPIRDVLMSVNEPQTYNAIAQAIAWHGPGKSTALRKNLGPAIEPALARQLKVEMQNNEDLNNKNRADVRTIKNLVQAIDRVGTAESIPVLQELAKVENVSFKSMANKTLKKIGGRTKNVRPTNETANTSSRIKVSTNAGEAFKSSVSNIVQGRIPPSIDRGQKAEFDPRNMWHSNKLESGWATVQLDFPERVTMDKIEIYSQHTGKHHAVVAAKVFTVSGSKSQLRCEADDLKQVASLKFKSAGSKKWKLELKAGESEKVVVRGLRFFDGERELYPQPAPPAPEQ